MGFPDGSAGKDRLQCKRYRRLGFDPWVNKILWRRKWQSIPVFLSEKFHGQRSLSGYSPKGCKESDTTEQQSTQDKMDITLFSDLVSIIKSVSNIGISNLLNFMEQMGEYDACRSRRCSLPPLKIL